MHAIQARKHRIRPRGSVATGFTLVELLTAIAIIMILAAIIIATFSNIRTSSMRSTNMSQIRNIGLACFLYANDHGGRIPVVVHHGPGPRMTQGPVLWSNQRQNPLSLLSDTWMEGGITWGNFDYLPGPDSFYGPFTPIANEGRKPNEFRQYGSGSGFLISYVYFSLPAEDFSTPKRSPLGPSLHNDYVNREAYLGMTPMISDPVSTGWRDLTGFTDTRVHVFHLNGSISTFDFDYLKNFGANQRIRVLAGLED